MKRIIIPLILFILICGCSSNQSDVETETTIVTPTPVAVTATWIQTVGPTPTPTDDISRCYWHNTTEYPDYCYDYFYWVRPIYSPVGSGYTARVWKNDSCVDLNRTSGVCESWGDGSYVEIFMHNQTIVRNLTGINATEVVAATVYYNKTFDLNTVNDDLSFSEFINKYWDGTYPSVKYNTDLFAPDPSVVIPVVNGTFNPDGF
jgi:hypothetical protein